MVLPQKFSLGACAGLIGLIGGVAACQSPQSGTGSSGTVPSTNSASQSPAPAAEIALQQLRIILPSRAGTTDVQRKADAIAKLLSTELKMPVEVAFLGSRAALKANQLAGAKLYLAEVRANYSGGNTYRSIFVVRNGIVARKEGCG
jgi:phosphonate transport system substrate-binding protein